MKLGNKLLLSSVLAGLLSTGAFASESTEKSWDFCSDESKVAIGLGSLGTAVTIATPLAPAGVIIGAVLNELLCTPEEVKSTLDSEVKLSTQDGLKTNDVPGAKTVYFDYDKYSLNETGKEQTTVTAEMIKKISGTSIRIEGNADSRGSDEYNYALGLKRANAVKAALVNAGVTNKLEVVSYGEAKPECTEATEDCFAKNRRVQFKIAE